MQISRKGKRLDINSAEWLVRMTIAYDTATLCLPAIP